ncbi:MAG: mercury transporter MerT [Geopsychrobacter sp.]|nr:mercury transporter MerT [Geopsychrobacter sp.]
MEALETSAQNEKKLLGFGLIGAVITGFLASACCLGPLLLVFLGIGSAGAFVVLEPYRLYFMVITLLFLGGGFYFTYRKPKADCEDSACCAKGSKKVQKILLWLATLFALLMLFFPQIMPFILD